MSTEEMNCRCRPSGVRKVLDKVRPFIEEETWHRLEEMNLSQFFELPPYPQDHVITMRILNCWDVDRTAFILGGKEIRFDADEVAMLIGMPNRGSLALWNKRQHLNVTASDIRNQFYNVSPGESSDRFVELFVKFLLTNLIFPSANFKVSRGLYALGEKIDAFCSYNWPGTICYFLTEQLNQAAMKIRRDQPLGYITGFVYLLTLWFYEHTSLVVPDAPDVRPRMLRWPVKVPYNSLQLELAFNRLNPAQVHDRFIDLRENEQDLLATPPEHPDPFLDLRECEHDLLANPVEPPVSNVVHLPQKETHSSPHSPIRFQSPTILQGNTSPPPKCVQTETNAPPQIGFPEIYHLLLDLKSYVIDRFTTLDNRLAKVELRLSEKERTFKPPRGDFPKTHINESPIFSLIRRIKDRGSRRKRKVTSPYIVFERKKRKRNVQKGDEVERAEVHKEDVEEVQKEADTQHQVIEDKMSIPEDVVDVHKDDAPYIPGSIHLTDEHEDPKVCPAPPVIDFPGRELIPEYMRETIDMCCRTFTDYGNFLFNMGHISLTRRYLDELLTNEWLGNEHVDTFAMLLEYKRRKEPALYRSYIYVSPLHWAYRNAKRNRFVEHVTKERIEKTDMILIPIINNCHWTLLVGAISEKKWRLYDSLANRMHLGIAREISLIRLRFLRQQAAATKDQHQRSIKFESEELQRGSDSISLREITEDRTQHYANKIESEDHTNNSQNPDFGTPLNPSETEESQYRELFRAEDLQIENLKSDVSSNERISWENSTDSERAQNSLQICQREISIKETENFMRSNWLFEQSFAENVEIQELLDRKTVSNFLAGELSHKLNQLIMSFIEKKGLQYDDEGREGCEEEEEEETMWRRNYEDFSDQDPSGSFMQNSSASGKDEDAMNDLRDGFAQIQSELSELRKMVGSCLEWQKRIDFSIKEGFSSAISQAVKRGKSSHKTKWKDSCYICCEAQVDTVLYRCGHMCACFQCSQGLQWNNGNCPICRSTIIDIVRVYPNI